MSEPAILACNSEHKTQVFSREEFESRLVSMREMYQEHKRKGISLFVVMVVLFDSCM